MVTGCPVLDGEFVARRNGKKLPCERLADENAELRKERDFYFNQVTENGERAQRAIDALNDENEKLRELVRDMFRDFANADNELKRYQGRTFMAVTRYVPRMRELGVEQ